MKDISWPIGRLPEDWLRAELSEVVKAGYAYQDAKELVEIFERKIAEFTGAPYAVAVDNCTDAVFLCLRYVMQDEKSDFCIGQTVTIPRHGYVSIPMAILNANLQVEFNRRAWAGTYNLEPTNIWDSAVRFTKGMYVPGQLQCLSFQIKKRLPIGKGGMILTDNREAYDWLRLARFEGRDEKHPQGRMQDQFDMVGWNMYMPPEDAARGILLFDKLMKLHPDGVMPDIMNYLDYPDLSVAEIFK